MFSETVRINTNSKRELIDITSLIEAKVREIKIVQGICLVFVPHSTCCLILTENESRLKRDWLALFDYLIPNKNWHHNQIDNNARAHLLAGLLGQEKVIPIIDGQLNLGTWQQLFLVEFDGPRERKVCISCVPWAGFEPARP